jgi:acyl-CoA-binding protein
VWRDPDPDPESLIMAASKPKLAQVFAAAVEFVKNSGSGGSVERVELSTDEKLTFYALFKQATDGICTAGAPSRLRMVARAKWNAWNELGSLTKAKAKRRYIASLTKAAPGWRETMKGSLTPKL